MTQLVGARIGDFAGAILSAVSALPPLLLSLDDSVGCTLAEDIVAATALPPYDLVAYDGYATKLADVALASVDQPVVLRVVDQVTAASALPASVRAGVSVKVETGARMPLGAEVVIPAEYTDGGLASVTISAPAPLGAGMRPTGCEVAQGTVVLSEGATLGVVQMAVLAAMGRREVQCFPRPRVVIVTTGEYGPSGTPTDGISHALAAGVADAGGVAYRVGAVQPQAHEMLTTLEDHLIRADLMVVCGGASLGPSGARGILPEVLAELGTVTFTPVAARPLGFVGFGTIGVDSTPFFALPSDPACALVAFEALIRPVIRVLAAGEGSPIAIVNARLDATITSERGICDLVPVSITRPPSMTPIATPLIRQGGHPPLAVLAKADGLAVVQEDVTLAAAGTKIDIMLFDKHRG